jgi:tRNA G18 (ribose-2'-O)-methylase SpoU
MAGIQSIYGGRVRGYFGIGMERVSKPMNMGNLFRTAQAFGASFCFTIGAPPHMLQPKSDTSKASLNLPVYHFESIDAAQFPRGCALVGVELTEDAIDLPSFHHPRCAAYVLGAEMFGLSRETLARCEYVIKIPTKFSLNVATAGAIVLYDRVRCLGGYPDRPIRPGGPELGPGLEKRPEIGKQPRVRIRMQQEKQRTGNENN